MDIHNPKAAHSVREFLIEIGTIICGILIALGLEQAVEAVHQRHAAGEAREAIRAELAADIGSLSNRASTEPCIARRFIELAAYIEAASAGTVANPPTWIGRPQVWNMEDQRWQAASQAGRVALLSPEDQHHFSDNYGSLKRMGEAEAQEQTLWAQLRSLEGQHHFSRDVAASMRSVLSQARTTDWTIRQLFLQTKDDVEKSGVRLWADPTYPGSGSVCLPTSMSREEALKRINSRYGEP